MNHASNSETMGAFEVDSWSCELAQRNSAAETPSVSNETYASLNGAYRCPSSRLKLFVR